MKEWEYILSEEDKLLIKWDWQKGKMVNFVVQYMALIDEEWRPIVRYNTKHNVAHKDKFHYSGKKERQEISGNKKDYDSIYKQAQIDIRKNYKKYKENYLFT